jgi:hypothetical protein
MTKYYKVQNSTILYLNSSFNCIKSNSITIAKTNAGAGYTSAPTIVITPASGDVGINASATATITGGAINTITMNNGGSGYNTLPTITLTGGGSPGVITGYSGFVAGTNYNALTTTITATGGGGASGSTFGGQGGSCSGASLSSALSFCMCSFMRMPMCSPALSCMPCMPGLADSSLLGLFWALA